MRSSLSYMCLRLLMLNGAWFSLICRAMTISQPQGTNHVICRRIQSSPTWGTYLLTTEGKKLFIHMDATFLHLQNIIINTHQGLNPLSSGGWALTHLEDHPLMPTWRVVLIFMACLPCSEIPLSLSLKQDYSVFPSLLPSFHPHLSHAHTNTRIQLPPCTLSFSLQLQLSLNSGLQTMMWPLESDV